MLSALARLLATVLSRTDCADMTEPAISNSLNDGMRALLLNGDRGDEAAALRLQEGQRGLEPHCVFCKGGLLHLHIDGVAIERGSERYSVFQIRGGLGTRSFIRAAQVSCAGGAQEHGAIRARRAGVSCSRAARLRECRAKVDVARLIAGGIGIREIACQHLSALAADLQRVRMDAEIRIEIDRHGFRPSENCLPGRKATRMPVVGNA